MVTRSTRLAVWPLMAMLFFVLASCWNDNTSTEGANTYPVTGIILDPKFCAVNADDQVDCDSLVVSSDGGGIFKSIDGGNTWNHADDVLDFKVTKMAMDPSDTDILFAGTENDGLYRSFDAGSSWFQINNSIVDISGIEIDPNSCQSLTCSDIYVGSRESGIWFSDNFGLTWAQMNDGLLEPTVTAMEIFSYNRFPAILYAGTEGGHLYRHDDLMQQWQALSPDLVETTVASPLVIAVNPINPADIYVGTSGGEAESQGGVFRSVNGSSWIKEFIPNGENFSVRVIAFCIQEEAKCPPVLAEPDALDQMVERPPDTLFAGVFGLSSKFFSVEGTWDNIDLGGLIHPGNNTSALTLDGIRHTAMFAGTLEGFVMKSLDGGVNWVRLDPEL